jgi:uncharacterized membrane protein YbhN (UPF0104 family)
MVCWRQMLGKIKLFRKVAAPVVVVLTLGLFVYFFVTNPAIRHTLASTNAWTILVIAALYGLLTLCLVWVYDVTLRLCGKRLDFKENFQLTCYSSIANFFGPLQSGPGVRAAYLKQKHQVKLRDYTLASLVYYAMFASVSAVFLLIGSGRYWPLAAVFLICVIGGSGTVVWLAKRQFTRKYESSLALRPRLLIELFVATLLQLFVWAIIFYVELSAIHTGASLTQAVAYGGAANFAVFVALTPGAIGFREAFLAFTQRLHGIDTTNIVSASLIDRAVYVAFLGLLFVLILGLHADRRFRVKPSPEPKR